MWYYQGVYIGYYGWFLNAKSGVGRAFAPKKKYASLPWMMLVLVVSLDEEEFYISLSGHLACVHKCHSTNMFVSKQKN